MRIFEKCLIHALTTPDMVRRKYIFPYSGNLTESKLQRMGDLLRKSIGHYYPCSPTADYVYRLKNEYLTGREANVMLRRDDIGCMSLSGKGWGEYGRNEGEYVVLEIEPSKVPVPITSQA